MKLIAPLGDFGTSDLSSAGGKGANLGELVRTGFPVPAGFVVTTAAYALIARPSLRHPEAFAQIDLPDELRAAITQAYAELGAGPVAVRSSATAEDLPGAAFAGQQDTYLNVVGPDAVVDAVRRCWGSLWTERAVAYRGRLGIDPDEVSIAVVVQCMVEADFAGVMFTANPVTGDREQIVVDASSGLGEAVVSGLVTPDHYVLDRRGAIREWTPGRREVVIRGAAGGGVTHETGSEVERLADDVLQRLAAFGVQATEHFGREQDMEWAVVGNEVMVLQARPMTALPPPPLRLNRRERLVGSVLLEYLPVRPYPIDVTTWLPHGPAGLMAKVARHFGIAAAFDRFLHEQDGVVDRLLPFAPHPTIRTLRAPVRIASLARRCDPARWTEDRRFHDFLEGVRELNNVDVSELPWEQLIRMPRRALDLVEPITQLRIAYLPRSGLNLLRLLLALKLLRRGELFGDLILGARTRTADANRELERIAAIVRADPKLRAAVEAMDVEQLNGFAEFQAFVAEYGHRETATPILATPPTWGESPETVVGLLKVLAANPPRHTDRAESAVSELSRHPLLRNEKRRTRMLGWIEAARAGVAFREDSHFYFTMPLPILRRSLLELGRRLFDDPEDVFHLRLEELEEQPVDRERLRALVRARAAKRDELAGVRLIDPAAIFPRSRDEDALVTGTPASTGKATGPVRVIREPSEFSNLEDGDILVCPYTNPSWTPLFQRAAAVVVDSGGVASHAAIVAREYGIPAIMGTARGTSTLTDGQIVTVDGGSGKVVAA